MYLKMISRDKAEAGQLVVPWVLLPEDRSDICFLQALGTSLILWENVSVLKRCGKTASSLKRLRVRETFPGMAVLANTSEIKGALETRGFFLTLTCVSTPSMDSQITSGMPLLR